MVPAVPDAPRNITVLNVTATTATISWLPPAQPAGIIEGYRIYSTLGNFTDAAWIRDAGPTLRYTLRNLSQWRAERRAAVARIWMLLAWHAHGLLSACMAAIGGHLCEVVAFAWFGETWCIIAGTNWALFACGMDLQES